MVGVTIGRQGWLIHDKATVSSAFGVLRGSATETGCALSRHEKIGHAETRVCCMARRNAGTHALDKLLFVKRKCKIRARGPGTRPC